MKHFLTSLEAQIKHCSLEKLALSSLFSYVHLFTTEKTIKKIEILVFLGFYF